MGYMDSVRNLALKATITKNDGTQIQLTHEDIQSYTISSSVGSGGLALGTTESASFTMSIDNVGKLHTTDEFDNAEVHVWSGIKNNNGTIEWTDFGVWYVHSCTIPEQSVLMELRGYDALDTLFSGEWTDDKGYYPTTIGSITRTVCALAGITCKSYNFPNAAVKVDSLPYWQEGSTWRDILSHIATCAGGFARIARDGKLEIVSYIEGTNREIGPDRYTSLTNEGGKKFDFNALSVQYVRDPDAESTEDGEDDYIRYAIDEDIEDNATNCIQVSGNPLITPTIAQSIVFELRDFKIAACNMNWGGDPAVECGDRWTITTTDDKEMHMLVNSQRFTFNGGLSVTESCELPSSNSTSSASYSTSSGLFDSQGNIRATRVSGLDKTIVVATEGHFNRLTSETVETDKLLASLIDVIKLRADNIDAHSVTTDKLTAALASIVEATINKLHAGTIETDQLFANMAEILALKAGTITAENIKTDVLGAQLAKIFTISSQVADFDFSHMKDLVADDVIITRGEADQLYIKRLAVTQANLLSAVIGTLVVKGSDDKYYEIAVGSGGVISTKEVNPTRSEIESSTMTDGRGIVETSINVRDLTAESIIASSADIATILTNALTANKITATQANIASANIPELRAVAIQALGDTLDLSANETIQMVVGQLDTVSDQAEANASAAAEDVKRDVYGYVDDRDDAINKSIETVKIESNDKLDSAIQNIYSRIVQEKESIRAEINAAGIASYMGFDEDGLRIGKSNQTYRTLNNNYGFHIEQVVEGEASVITSMAKRAVYAEAFRPGTVSNNGTGVTSSGRVSMRSAPDGGIMFVVEDI